MNQIITAPSIDMPLFNTVFLAGGITGCPNWQQEVIDYLKDEDITIYNPRRERFDIDNPGEAHKQILWEYARLECMDIFSMYFCSGDSDQPICMYELGRNILRMQTRFPSDWQNRIVLSVEDGYKRKQDVMIQVGLSASGLWFNEHATPETHAFDICRAVRWVNRAVTCPKGTVIYRTAEDDTPIYGDQRGPW